MGMIRSEGMSKEETAPVVVNKDGICQIRVSGGSQVKETAGCIVKSWEDGNIVQVRAIGASAVNQMYKALATSCVLFAQKGLVARVRPGYDEAEVWDSITNQNVKKTLMVGYIDVEKG